MEVEKEVLGLFCGREESDTEQVPGAGVLSSSNNLLSLLFHSDFSDQENHAGFLAHYTAVGKTGSQTGSQTGRQTPCNVHFKVLAKVWTIVFTIVFLIMFTI